MEKMDEPEGPARKLGSITILLVEDSSLLASSLARCLARRGYIVRTAATTAEAEASVEKEPLDCGIFDIQLGDEDGITLAARLLDARRVRCVVFYSGTIDGLSLDRAAALGPLVHKEEPLEELARAVLAEVERAQAAESARR